MRRRIGTTVLAGLTLWAFAFAPGMASANVSSLPAATPQLATTASDGTVEQIRQLTQCGTTMYAVGKFTAVKNANSTAVIARNNAFAFSAVSPYRVTDWDPNVNGQVDTVACGATSGEVLLGGVFTSAGGLAVKNIARVDATLGAGLPFNMKPGGRVAHIEVVKDAAQLTHAIVGGYFPGYLKSLNPTTGVEDSYRMPTIAGTYVFPGVKSNPTRIWNMTVSPDPGKTAVLMTGVFTSVGGQHHEQIFRLNLTAGTPTVSAWSPTELYQDCATVEPFYAQDAAWSPDMTKIYTATTGYKPYDKSASVARSGPCDAAIAYPVEPQAEFGGANGSHLWINYTGCDSLFSVAADSTTVFIGGHQRYINNPAACDKLGASPARAQPGLGEIDQASGLAQVGPSRGRGLGADDMIWTPGTTGGLWIASDNQANTSTCAGKGGHMGLCFLPN
jgi:hypothetical protein